jgi:hypothetical protein
MGQTAIGLKHTRFLWATLVVLVVSCCLAGVSWLSGHWGQPARRQWKEEAIPLIAKWADDQKGRAQEIGALTNRTAETRVLEAGWLTDKMILMGSGEWLIYKSHCSKEAPHLVNDIFLAKCSDGRWYYSTFHFCVRMVALRMEQETQPPNLAMFVHEYNLRPFDGQSDDCLKETATWPASWGEKTNANSQGP